MTVGLYKNDILVPDSTRIMQSAGPNVLTDFNIQSIISFDGDDIFTIKVNTSSISSNLIIYNGNLIMAKITNIPGFDISNSQQYNISNSVVMTNSTSPIELSDLINIPTSGNYIILYNFIYSVSKSNRSCIFGLYKDNTLISYSSRTVTTIANNKLMFQENFITTFSGTEAIKLNINVSNNDTTLSIYERNLILIPIWFILKNK